MAGSLVSGFSQTVLFDQTAFLDDASGDIRNESGVNYMSQRGVPLSDQDGVPPGSDDGRAPTNPDPIPSRQQFQGVVTYGAVSLPSSRHYDLDGEGNITTLRATAKTEALTGDAKDLGLPHTLDADLNVSRVLRVQVGAPYMMRSISFLFGSVIDPPLFKFNQDGVIIKSSPMTPVQAAAYWSSQPVLVPVEEDNPSTGFYYSPHARKVYAIKPGRVEVTWRRVQAEIPSTEADKEYFHEIGGNFFRKYTVAYTVSGAPVKPPRKVFWTEETFETTAPLISIDRKSVV